MSGFRPYNTNGGFGSGGAGAWIIGVKVTNDQPMVFTSEANRDSYFSANPDELSRIEGSSNIVGIGTIVEDTSSVPSDGWYAYGYQGVATWRQTIEIATGARGEAGPPGSTPNVIVEQVAAPAHGFTNADVLLGLGLRRDATDSRNWLAASSADINTCASALLADVVDANNILVILEGTANQVAHGFTVGDIYYLGDDGYVTNTIPVTGRAQQIFTVSDINNVLINIGQSHDVELSDKSFQAIISGFGHASGTILPEAQANKLVVDTLGIDAFWRTTAGRIMPQASQTSNSWFVWNNNAADETTASANVSELILPAESVRGKALVARIARTSSGGTREFRVYDGDPSTGAQEIFPIYGNGNAIQSNQQEVVFDIDRPDGVANDIHIVPKIQGVFNLELVSRMAYTAAHVESSNFKEAVATLFADSQIGNGGPLNTLANNMLSVLGVGGAFRTTAGRVYPVGFGNGVGFFSNAAGDETAATANVCEYVIPAGRVTHNQVFEIRFGQVSSGGSQRDIRFYAGDPTTTGVKIEPVLGTEAHGNTDVTYWRVSTTPESGGLINYDLHIVFSFCVVQDISLHTDLPLNESVSGTGVFRGGIPSLVNGTTISYTAGNGEILSLLGTSNLSVGVTWAQNNTYTPPVATDGDFILTIDINGNPNEIDAALYSPETRRDVIVLGAFNVTGGAIVSVTPFVISANEPLHQMFDFMECFGATVKDGLEISANGANLQIDLSTGDLHFIGAGSQQNNRQENMLDITGVNATNFVTLLGVTGIVDGTANANTLNPAVFDNGSSVPVNVPGGPGNTTVQRVYILPASPATVYVVLGQQTYADLAEAVSLDAESSFQLPDFMKNAVLRARIAMTRTATSLQDGTDTSILHGSKFGNAPLGGGGGGTSGGGSSFNLPVTGDVDLTSNTTFNIATRPQGTVIDAVDRVARIYLQVTDKATGDFVYSATLEFTSGPLNTSIGELLVTNFLGANDLPTLTNEFRLTVADSTDPLSAAHLQSVTNYGAEVEVTVVSYLAFENDLVVGSLSLYTPGANELIVDEVNTTNWVGGDVTSGKTKGQAVTIVGDFDGVLGARTDYRNQQITSSVGAVDVHKVIATGTRVNGGEYGNFDAPTTTDWPIDATFFTTLIAEKRPDVVPPALPDTTKNPSSTVTLTGIDIGGVTAATMTGFDGAHRGLRFATAGGGGLEMTFADCLYQTINLTMRFGVATSSGGATQDYEIVDSNGTQLAEWTILGPVNNVGSTHIFDVTIDTMAGDEVITLRKRSTGTSQAVYMFDYDMTLIVEEPALEAGVVAQFDSPIRGMLPPRILPSSTVINHTQGSFALDGLSGRRPILYRGDDWNYFVTNRFDISSVEYAALLLPTSTPSEQSWTGGDFVTQEVFQGFNTLRFPNSTVSPGVGNISMTAPFFNTLAAWQEAFNLGFRMDWRGLIPVAGNFHGWNFEPFAGSGFPSGQRVVVNVQDGSAAGLFDIKDENSNTVISDIDGTVMNNISIVFPPGGGAGAVLLNNVKILDATWGGANPARGLFIFDNGSATREIYYQSLSMYVISATQIDRTYTEDEIDNSIVEIIPSVANDLIRRVPKGLRSPGDNFTIDNGSSGTVTVSGETDDIQLFGSATSFVVPPNTKVVFTNSAWPQGVNWLTSIVSTQAVSNSVFILIESGATSILYRDESGTFKGTLTLAAPQTGQYTITPAGPVLGDTGAFINATAYHSAGTKITVNANISLGQAFIDVLDAGGNRVNDRVWVEIRWPL